MARRITAGTSLRDRILIGLSDKAALLRVIESTHGVGSWGRWARESSLAELREGTELIDAEGHRLQEKLRHMRSRRDGLGEELARASADAEVDRLMRRLQEIADQRETLRTLAEKVRCDVEVDTIEWQRPLVLADGTVTGFVDIFATLRVSYYRLVRGTDPNDHERRQRYEGYNSQHLTRSYLVEVIPSIRSLSEAVKRIRFVQAHVKDASPVVVTCAAVAPEVLAAQGIPTYVWSADGQGGAAPGLSLATRRSRRVEPRAAQPATHPSLPGLPSPRPSLPPARSP